FPTRRSSDLIITDILFGSGFAGLGGRLFKRALRRRDHQVRRSVNCNVRAPWPEFRVASMPVLPKVLGLPGWFSTLKKSTFNRALTRSVIGILLNADASRPHWRMLGDRKSTRLN